MRDDGTKFSHPGSVLAYVAPGARRSQEDISSQRDTPEMDKTIVGVIGAVTGLASLDGAAQAATAPTPDALPAARSYAELLDPIPNAVAALQAADAAAVAREAQQPAGEGVQLALEVRIGHHHHHHH